MTTARSVRPRRSRRASRRSISSPSPRSSWSPGAASGSSSDSRRNSPAGRGAERAVTAAGQLVGEQARRAEAVGQRGGGQRRQLAERPDPQPLERLGQLGERRAGAQQRDGQRREVGPCQLPGLRPSAGQPIRQDPRPSRARADDLRAPGPRPGRRRDRGEPRRGDPEARRQPQRRCAPPAAPPRSPRAAAAAPARRSTPAPGARARPPPRPTPGARAAAPRGRPRPPDRAGRASAADSAPAPRPAASRGGSPNASAASETSPTCCVPPGSGASATGLRSSSERSPTAVVSAKRGIRTQTIIRTYVRTRVGRRDGWGGRVSSGASFTMADPCPPHDPSPIAPRCASGRPARSPRMAAWEERPVPGLGGPGRGQDAPGAGVRPRAAERRRRSARSSSPAPPPR